MAEPGLPSSPFIFTVCRSLCSLLPPGMVMRDGEELIARIPVDSLVCQGRNERFFTACLACFYLPHSPHWNFRTPGRTFRLFYVLSK